MAGVAADAAELRRYLSAIVNPDWLVALPTLRLIGTVPAEAPDGTVTFT
jgi:hypothetical protein